MSQPPSNKQQSRLGCSPAESAREIAPAGRTSKTCAGFGLTHELLCPAMSQPSPQIGSGPELDGLYDLASRFAAAAERALARCEVGARHELGAGEVAKARQRWEPCYAPRRLASPSEVGLPA